MSCVHDMWPTANGLDYFAKGIFVVLQFSSEFPYRRLRFAVDNCR